MDRQNDCIECKVEGEALCYSSVDFFPLKELQVDHAQPSSNLIYRQSELIKAMNFDNLYGMSLLLSPENYGYFILDKNLDGIVPTKKFYMDYHNYYENLWLITNGTNSAADKGCKDFVDWLANHDGYGDDFFASIGGVESIDRSAIIFTTSDGMLLCDAAKSWFREKNKEEIIKVGFMTNEVTSIMIDRNSASTQEEKAFNVVSFTAMSHMAKNRNLIFGSENGSLNKASEDYLHDSDGEFTDENIEIARNVIRSFNEEISDVYTKVKNKYIELRRLN